MTSSAFQARHAHAGRTWRGGALVSSSTPVLVVCSFTAYIIAQHCRHRTCVHLYVEVSDQHFAGAQGVSTLGAHPGTAVVQAERPGHRAARMYHVAEVAPNILKQLKQAASCLLSSQVWSRHPGLSQIVTIDCSVTRTVCRSVLEQAGQFALVWAEAF